MLSRRAFLSTASASLAYLTLPRTASAQEIRMTPAAASIPVMPGQSETKVWAYNNSLPGPVLRVKQNERLRVRLDNRLPQDTTIHWHGIRLPNAMDGVPGLTQKPVKPGASFAYDFTCQDAGTFWYHPHAGNPEQVGRGLYGLLIVDEPNPPPVDRDVAWVLSDLRLDKDMQITNDFRHPMDLTHAGRLGNVALNNGRLVQPFPINAGERIRLRLVNTANARIFDLRFDGHAPWLIALDGHPVPPRQLAADGRVILGPGMRADLIIDLTAEPGKRYTVFDRDMQGREHRLTDLAYGDDVWVYRRAPLPSPKTLTANPVGEPDLAKAERLPLILSGGMGVPSAFSVDGGRRIEMREAFQKHQIAWSLNGQAMADHSDHLGHRSLFDLKLGRSYIFEVSNETSWPHPIHLHGHVFRQLDLPDRPWADTALLQPGEKTRLALLADNKGHWMLHCHILEHQVAGMMATVKVG